MGLDLESSLTSGAAEVCFGNDLHVCLPHLLSYTSCPVHSTAKTATFIVHTTSGIFLFLIKMSKDGLTKRWMKLPERPYFGYMPTYAPLPPQEICTLVR